MDGGGGGRMVATSALQAHGTDWEDRGLVDARGAGALARRHTVAGTRPLQVPPLRLEFTEADKDGSATRKAQEEIAARANAASSASGDAREVASRSRGLWRGVAASAKADVRERAMSMPLAAGDKRGGFAWEAAAVPRAAPPRDGRRMLGAMGCADDAPPNPSRAAQSSSNNA